MTEADEAFAAVVDRVRESVTPDAAERERLDRVTAELRERAERAVAERGLAADVVLVGSTARGTWLAGDRDVDLFVRFSTEYSRERLEREGLAVGHAVLPDGHEEYAEHPYVKGVYEGFDVDCVPCYDVESASDIRSAVDRTPFHTAYLDERLDDDLAGDVRVTKAFLKGIGAYGSDLRTRGFAGYLAELLVLEHGGFRELIVAAADWSPPIRLDPEGHRTATFDDLLVVVDPTDPERNVAASLSTENLARLIHYGRELLTDPRATLFEPRDPEPMDGNTVRARVRERGTHPVAVRFNAPDVVEDQLYPQLDKSLAGLAGELNRRGFDPLRTARFANGTAVLFVECEVAERPAVERHQGPPVGVREHATGFYAAYADDKATAGPYLDGERYVVERSREHRTPEAFAASDDLFGVALGPAVERALRADYDVLAGTAVSTLAEEFGRELAAYFEPRV
jgi:tRNA nucleotidyltransferase (CCA-adding enzyme)